MSRLLEAIDAVGEAADKLTRACARQAAIVDATTNENPFTTALRRQFQVAAMTPTDMLATLGRVK
jgi:hypothetical protein